jgi:hypothetical protein
MYKNGDAECDYDTFFCKIRQSVMFILYVVMCMVTSSTKDFNPKYASSCRVVMCLV